MKVFSLIKQTRVLVMKFTSLDTYKLSFTPLIDYLVFNLSLKTLSGTLCIRGPNLGTYFIRGR